MFSYRAVMAGSGNILEKDTMRYAGKIRGVHHGLYLNNILFMPHNKCTKMVKNYSVKWNRYQDRSLMLGG